MWACIIIIIIIIIIITVAAILNLFLVANLNTAVFGQYMQFAIQKLNYVQISQSTTEL